MPWSSNIPKRYKRYAINADLHHSKLISTNFDKGISRIKMNFLAADYPRKFLESNFENDKVQSVEDDNIIPQGFFDIAQPVIIVEVSFCAKNEVSSKQFLPDGTNTTCH